jgi:signal transduction histidine kinase
MLINRTSDVEILEPAESPFALPLQRLESLYRHLSAHEPFRRSRVAGVVTAYVPGRPLTVHDNASGHAFSATAHVLYIQDGTGVARVETDQPTVVSPGDRVDVAGFPYVTPGKPILKYAAFRVVGAESEPQPVELTLPFLLTPDRDASLVSLRARLLGVVASNTRRALVLEAGDGTIDATLHGGPADDAMAGIRPGSLVQVTGVYAYQAGSPPSFRLFLRSSRDVVLLQAAPWWTLGHTAVLAALVTTVVAAAAVGTWASARRRRQRYQAILDERTRVARELHDTLEQGLAGIALQLEAVAGTLGSSTEPARRPLDLARRMLRYSLEEARRSVLDLRSQALETTDLAGALSGMAHGMASSAGVVARVSVTGFPRRLDAEREHHLLRIGLEAVTNALKHARPKRIDIELTFADATVDLLVRDDGAGMAVVQAPTSHTQFGLRGIRERADKLGGMLRIDTQPGAGTTIAITVPLRSDRRRSA